MIFIRKSYGTETSVSLVYSATWPDELKINVPLEDMAAKASGAGITKHAMDLVKKAVEGIGDGELSLLRDALSHGYRG